MGKLIILYKNNRRESLKCKSYERAEQIISKRNNVANWEFFEAGRIRNVPASITGRQKEKHISEMNQSELENFMKQRGLLY